MKYVHFFSNVSSYNQERTNNYIEPWVSYTQGDIMNYNKPKGTVRMILDSGASCSFKTNFLTYQEASQLLESIGGAWPFWQVFDPFKLEIEGPVSGWSVDFSESCCYSVTLPDGIEMVGYDENYQNGIFNISEPLGKDGLISSYPSDYGFEIHLPSSVLCIGMGFLMQGGKYSTNIIIYYPGTTQQWNNLTFLPGWHSTPYYNGNHLIIRCSNGDILDPPNGAD